LIAIIDYRAGNLTSVRLALEYIGAPCEITSDPSRVLADERVIFPGVGAAAEAMKNLTEFGLIEPIRELVATGKPFLGICLGTQVIFEFSEEDGGTPCIGLVPGSVKLFTPSEPACKIPQIGWNTVEFKRSLCVGADSPPTHTKIERSLCVGADSPPTHTKIERSLRVGANSPPTHSDLASETHPLFEGIENQSEFYFVHSYYPAPSDPGWIVGETDYAGARFASAIGRGNLFATQFHPERSGRIGLRLLDNFARWDGKC